MGHPPIGAYMCDLKVLLFGASLRIVSPTIAHNGRWSYKSLLIQLYSPDLGPQGRSISP